MRGRATGRARVVRGRPAPAGRSPVGGSFGVCAAALAVVLTGCAGAPPDPAPAAAGVPGTTAADAAPPGCLPPPPPGPVPQRVVAMDGGAAAVLVRLGVGDRVVGTAAPDFLREFSGAERARLDAIPVLDEGSGNAEVVLAARPELVVGISALSFGGFDGTPTVERLAAAGARTLAACGAGGDGPQRDLASATDFFTEVAAAMGVPERGAELVARFDDEVAQARAAAPDRPVRVLSVSGAPAPGQPVRTSGGRSFANAIIAQAGGVNIAEDVPDRFAALGGEEVAARDPEAIVVISGLGPDSPEVLLAAVRADPLLAGTTAGREDRIVVVPQSQVLAPGLLAPRAVAAIAATLDTAS